VLHTHDIRASLAAYGLDASDAELLDAVRTLSDRDAELAGGTKARDLDSVVRLHPKRLELFDYQQDIVEQLLALATKGRIGLVSLPTGAGKTRTAVTACLEMQRREARGQILWLAPSRELATQARATLCSIWEATPLDYPVAIVGLQSECSEKRCWRFGTIQAAAAMGDRLAVSGHDTVFVFDEAHQATAPSYRRVVRTLQKTGAVVIGLSATPGRYTDRETCELAELFDSSLITPRILGTDPVRSLRTRGVLAELQREDLGDPRDIAPIQRIDRLAGRILELQSSPGLAFVSKTSDAYLVAARLTGLGVRSEVVSHNHSTALREEKLARLRSGHIDWLVNVEVLATGIDIPMLKAIALLTEIGSSILYEQILGRVCRGVAVGGRDRTLVFDAFNHFRLHGDASSYSRFLSIAW
jgi:DNA repair protein RadD